MTSSPPRNDHTSDRSPADPRSITTDLLPLVDLDPAAADRVQFTGPKTVLPSSYRIAEGAQALVAAVSLAVDRVGAARTAQPRPAAPISVDSVRACAAFQSERHFRLEDPPQLWDELSGHYRSADGFIQFHTNFPHHRRAVLEATGCPPDAPRKAVAAVVAESGRFEMEHRVTEAGGIAAALRTLGEWRQHPHHDHLVGRPPVRIATNGDRSRQALPQGSQERPLAGLRVLDFTRVIAGPVCTRTLAAYGAHVLRIGAPDLPVVDSILPDTTLGKRFANADITTDNGRDTALRLASQADVVIIGFRPGALDGYGLGTEQLFDANPRLVIGSLSAFGPDGPWGGKRGFDSITQTATGIVDAEMAAFGTGKPKPLPCQFLDHGTGFFLTLGVLGALLDRHNSGGGHSVETSLLTTRNWLESLGSADPALGRQLTEEDVAPFIETRQSTYGPLRHIPHPGRIDGTPARWDHGPQRPGADRAGWGIFE